MPKRLTLDEMWRIAASRGGKCLSRGYWGSLTPLRWQCAIGHQWWAIPNSVRRGSWCRECFHAKRRRNLEDLQLFAAERGGRLVTAAYLNSQTRLEWECALGHRWSAIANSVIRGSWCPECAVLARRRHARASRALRGCLVARARPAQAR